MSKVTGFEVLLEMAHTSPGWCWTSIQEMRAGPGVLEFGGAGGLLFRTTSEVLMVSEKEGVVVAMKVVPMGERESAKEIKMLTLPRFPHYIPLK